jgi:hypothetical protein
LLRRSEAFGLAFALRELVCERIREIEGSDRGQREGQRMTMKFSSLGGFAAHLLTIEADLELAREVCVEKACRMVEKEAKAAIGTYRFEWPPLQPETITRKARGDTPLLETGELRDSIQHVVATGRYLLRIRLQHQNSDCRDQPKMRTWGTTWRSPQDCGAPPSPAMNSTTPAFSRAARKVKPFISNSPSI